MLPNLAVLQKQCQTLGLAVAQKGKRPAKSDYVDVLRAHFLERDYPQGMPFEETTPMLCFASWNLSDDEMEAIWQSEDWIAEQKENGCRLMLHFTRTGTYAHSRTPSRKTYRFQELTGKLLFSKYTHPVDVTLDCEVIVEKSIDTRKYTAKGEITKTSLHSTTSLLHLEDESSKACQQEQDAPLTFKVLDCTKLHIDLKGQPLKARLKAIGVFLETIKGTEIARYFERKPHVAGKGKKAFLKQIWDQGGEGVVLKNLESTYEDSSSRSRTGWVKIKRRMEVDAFVTGFKPGEAGAGYEDLVGALEWSVNLTEGGTHVIGFTSNMELEFRKAITVTVDGKPTLRKDLYGKVGEISGQDISAREYRLSHCTHDRWRDQTGDEKNAQDCTMSLKDLKQMAEWVA